MNITSKRERMDNIAEKAKAYAFKCHEETNHLYDGKPYGSAHLELVNDVIEAFIELIPVPDQDNVRGGGWTHDTVEDCRQTYNDVKKATNETVAELAYALTNEKGKTRAERANDKYYAGIRKVKYAKFLKLADRIANVTYSYQKRQSYKGEGMFVKYGKENPDFIWKLIKPEWYEIHQHIGRLMVGKKNYIFYRKYNDVYLPLINHLENLIKQK